MVDPSPSYVDALPAAHPHHVNLVVEAPDVGQGDAEVLADTLRILVTRALA